MHANRELHIVAVGKVSDRPEHPLDLALERALPVVELGVPYDRGVEGDDWLCRIEPDRRDDIAGFGRVGGMKCDPVLRSLFAIVEIADELPTLVVIEIQVLPHRVRLGEHGAVISLAMAENEAARAIGWVPGDEADARLPRRLGNQRLWHVDAMMADDHIVALARKQPAHGEKRQARRLKIALQNRPLRLSVFELAASEKAERA